MEFVQALRMPGSERDRKREMSPPPQVKALQTIQETKKSLPIYPFRNDLIQAIKDHQVLRGLHYLKSNSLTDIKSLHLRY